VRLWPAIAASSIGLTLGLGLVTLDHAEALTYLSEDPRTCVNCHIMRSQYDSWQKSSHHGVASCNGCHLPEAFPWRYVEKARNGWFHSKAFTLQNFHEPIRITPHNAAILQASCLRCHEAFLHDASAATGAPRCVSCHPDVGHGEPLGLGGPWRGPHHEDSP